MYRLILASLRHERNRQRSKTENKHVLPNDMKFKYSWLKFFFKNLSVMLTLGKYFLNLVLSRD
ncbi:hypothetical protein BpHYR1_036303 [Brachionus plicatilis]|uniref:Uncharacterized protein n=1 Tax=Brachionus plicatilis TaxID=10195 RepID=A0A3M7SLU3_BRAPC|nr:hypothetical protein BpHYR1_036303 [Brachionus plicatilis]